MTVGHSTKGRYRHNSNDVRNAYLSKFIAFIAVFAPTI